MLELTRTVRFAVNPRSSGDERDPWGAPSNTFASYPSMSGLGRHYELDIVCRGETDPDTGYFLNIREIDQAARVTLIPAIERACSERPWASAPEVLAEALPGLDRALGGGRVHGVRWRLSPHFSVEVQMATPGTALLRQQFEFAASHRLHVAGLSDEENRTLFGKCNNPHGHGHNYRVEPAVEVGTGPGTGGAGFSLAELERITHETVIKRFDHKHLNLDTEEFRTGKGLNPSVENIARVCFELLASELKATHPEVRLRGVTVWETDKTSCTYPA